MTDQFSRTEILIGKDAVERLKSSSVALFGVGGVGGFVAEALARAGIGSFDLIDNDTVSVTNLNRQIIALHSTVGRYKTEVMKDEMKNIKARYDEIISGLGLTDFTLDKDFEEIAAALKADPQKDYAASRGEYLNGKIMAAYLGIDFIDAAEVIFFNAEGNLNNYKTEKMLSARLRESKRAVIPGFYGLGKDGNVKTLSRGGSDVTGSIVAQAS